jgi:hypothetical protein
MDFTVRDSITVQYQNPLDQDQSSNMNDDVSVDDVLVGHNWCSEATPTQM